MEEAERGNGMTSKIEDRKIWFEQKLKATRNGLELWARFGNERWAAEAVGRIEDIIAQDPSADKGAHLYRMQALHKQLIGASLHDAEEDTPTKAAVREHAKQRFYAFLDRSFDLPRGIRSSFRAAAPVAPASMAEIVKKYAAASEFDPVETANRPDPGPKPSVDPPQAEQNPPPPSYDGWSEVAAALARGEAEMSASDFAVADAGRPSDEDVAKSVRFDPGQLPPNKGSAQEESQSTDQPKAKSDSAVPFAVEGPESATDAAMRSIMDEAAAMDASRDERPLAQLNLDIEQGASFQEDAWPQPSSGPDIYSVDNELRVAEIGPEASTDAVELTPEESPRGPADDQAQWKAGVGSQKIYAESGPLVADTVGGAYSAPEQPINSSVASASLVSSANSGSSNLLIEDGRSVASEPRQPFRKTLLEIAISAVPALVIYGTAAVSNPSFVDTCAPVLILLGVFISIVTIILRNPSHAASKSAFGFYLMRPFVGYFVVALLLTPAASIWFGETHHGNDEDISLSIFMTGVLVALGVLAVIFSPRRLRWLMLFSGFAALTAVSAGILSVL